MTQLAINTCTHCVIIQNMKYSFSVSQFSLSSETLLMQILLNLELDLLQGDSLVLPQVQCHIAC